MKFIKEFKEFAIKGNMFDMAIGIIIGTAFNKIVSSLVNDIITPLFAYWLGNTSFNELKWVLQEKITDASGTVTQEMISINYGIFIQLVLDFLIIAFSIFVVIRVFNKLRNKADNEKDTSVPTPKEIALLSEIRDLLKHRSESQ